MNPLSIIQVATRTARPYTTDEMSLGLKGSSTREKQSWQKRPYEKAHHPVRYAWKNSIRPALISICLVLLVVGGIIGVGCLWESIFSPLDLLRLRSSDRIHSGSFLDLALPDHDDLITQSLE